MTPTIDDIQAWLGASLPDGYRQFLEEHSDDFDATDLVLLYGRSSFIDHCLGIRMGDDESVKLPMEWVD